MNIINKNDIIKKDNLNIILENEENKINEHYSDYKLNNLEYLEALEYDNRKFFKVY